MSNHDRSEPSATTTVTREVSLTAAPTTVWLAMGSFAAISSWHPVVARSEAETVDGVEHRRLTTIDGATLLEKMIAHDDAAMRSAYTMVETPLPVADYEAELTVEAAGAGARVRWSGRFRALDPAAEKLVAGIYETGLAALKDRFA